MNVHDVMEGFISLKWLYIYSEGSTDFQSNGAMYERNWKVATFLMIVEVSNLSQVNDRVQR